MKDTTQWRCKSGVAENYRLGELTCNCPERCERYAMDFSVSNAQWPSSERPTLQARCKNLYNTLQTRRSGTDSTCTNSTNLKGSTESGNLITKLNECKDGNYAAPFSTPEEFGAFVVGKRFAEVFIYFNTFEYQSIVEDQMIDFAELLAYMGGILGLFFGFSFLTLFEYIQLLIDCIVYGFARCCGGQNKIKSSRPGSQQQLVTPTQDKTRQAAMFQASRPHNSQNHPNQNF